MRLLHSLLAAIAFIGLSLTAHADSVVFDFKDASFGTGYDVVGNITINTASGTITATNFSIGSQSFVGAAVTSASSPNYFGTVIFANRGKSNQAGFGLYIPTADNTLVGYTGGSICSNANTCAANASVYYPPQVYFKTLSSGSLVPQDLPAALPAAVTPEPSSLALLGTGIVGVAGAARRRFLTR